MGMVVVVLMMAASPFTSHIIIHQQWRIDTKSDTSNYQDYSAVRSSAACLPRSIILLSLHANIMHTNQDNTAATGGQSTVKMPIGRKSIININYARRTVLDDH